MSPGVRPSLPFPSVTVDDVKRVPRTLGEILLAAGKEFAADRASRMAAALAYYAIFALAPLLVLAVSVAGFVFGEQAAEGTIRHQLTDTVGEQVANAVEGVLRSAFETRFAAGTVGLLLAIWAGSAVFLQVQGALDTVFEAPEHEHVHGLVRIARQRALAFAAAVGLGVVLLALLVANALLANLGQLIPDEAAWLRTLLSYVAPTVSFLLLIGIFSLMFQYLTRLRLPWRAVLRGAAFTAVLFVAGGYAVGFYLGRVAGAGTFGAVGAVAILLFFAYLMAQIFLFGAEVTKVYADYLEHGDIVQPSARRETAARIAADQIAADRARPKETSTPTVAVWAFLIGLVVGWWRRRR